MASTMKTEVQPLTREAIHAVLARNRVGRLVYSRGNVIDIQPVHYVYSEGWLYGRTSPDVQLGTLRENWWPVVFEVDEVDGRSEWRCVVVRGGFYTLSSAASAWERSEYDQAVHLLRSLEADPLEGADGAADVVFRLAVQEASGRRMSMSRRESAPLPAAEFT